MKKTLVLDFGSQYTQLIARKIRELGVYSEIHPFSITPGKIRKRDPGALVLSGGPRSVYGADSPLLPGEVFQLGVPVLGICYGLQLMAHILGGKVSPSRKGEYGFASLRVRDRKGLLKGIRDRSQVWMSHGDKVLRAPPGFIVSGVTADCPVAVMEDKMRNLFGVQFHPEVIHTKQGMKVLENFLFGVAGLKKEWKMGSFVRRKAEEIRRHVDGKKIICGLSGGVDSLVASLIVKEAVGRNLTCIFVDNGLLRKGEFEGLLEVFRRRFGLNVKAVDASESFLRKLRGVVAPERKRKIIGKEFIRIFEQEARKIGDVEFLAQGTIYPDVIESTSVKGPSSKIKSHHNVGGLPRNLKFQLVEPLRNLFKDEVRRIGRQLGVDDTFIRQHPFPGPGLAVRVVGEVTRKRLEIVREADRILMEEIRRARLYDRLWQGFAVLLPVRAVGVMGDRRTYQSVVVLRMVRSVDGMTAHWYPVDHRVLSRISSRIVNEVEGVNRVLYDVTTKPPGTIEWE